MRQLILECFNHESVAMLQAITRRMLYKLTHSYLEKYMKRIYIFRLFSVKRNLNQKINLFMYFNIFQKLNFMVVGLLKAITALA